MGINIYAVCPLVKPLYVCYLLAMGKNAKTLVSLRMTDDELALLERLSKSHGGKTAALVAGLRMLNEEAYDLRAVSSQELLAELQRRLIT